MQNLFNQHWLGFGAMAAGAVCILIAVAPHQSSPAADDSGVKIREQVTKEVQDTAVSVPNDQVKVDENKIEYATKQQLEEVAKEISNRLEQLELGSVENAKSITANSVKIQSVFDQVKSLLGRDPIKEVLTNYTVRPERSDYSKPDGDSKGGFEVSPLNLGVNADMKPAASSDTAQTVLVDAGIIQGEELGRLVVSGNAFDKNGFQIQPIVKITLKKKFEVGLSKAMSKLQDDEPIIIRVEGHASPEFNGLFVDPSDQASPAYQFNFQLAEIRARFMKEFIENNFLSGLSRPVKLDYKSYSHTKPVAGTVSTGCGPYDCSLSRRVEVVFFGSSAIPEGIAH